MHNIRSSRSASVVLTSCPACGQQHSFDFQAIIDEVVGVMHFMAIRTETRTCAVNCPNSGKLIMVDVPVTLYSGQTLVSVK